MTAFFPRRSAPSLLALALATAAAFTAQAQTAATPAATLTPPAERITDRAIDADLQTYEAMQARLKAINDGGRPVRDYHLAKAQCWLDVSFHEYNRNDRGPFPQDALAEAHKLASGMERGQPPLGSDTPLISGAQRLRPDLWALAQGLKGHPGYRCAQQKLACGEVELVHAGHEQMQQQWRHAKPYVQIAEDLIAEAQALAERCDPPPAPRVAGATAEAPPPVVVVPPPPPPPPPAPVPDLQLSVSVVFSFDRHTAADIRPQSMSQLEALATRIKTEGLVVQSLRLAGHADRLNGTGNTAYNQRLSERRAATVREQLNRLGVDTSRTVVEAFGDGRQVQPCNGPFANHAELQECLLPNRRVEVIIGAQPARR